MPRPVARVQPSSVAPADSGAVIGYTDIPLTKAQPESTLGNFVADAMLLAAQRADPEVAAAVSNYGGIRLAYIAPGAITMQRLTELMPFNNRLVILDVPGAALQQLCDVIAERKGWPVSGITFTIKEGRAVHVLVAGAPLHPALVYKVAINDYMARGGDRCSMLAPLKQQPTKLLVRDALISYLAALQRAGRPLHPVLEERIRYAE